MDESSDHKAALRPERDLPLKGRISLILRVAVSFLPLSFQ
jgi:hypothetical protein